MRDKLSKELNAKLKSVPSKSIHIVDKELDLGELFLLSGKRFQGTVCHIVSEGNERVLHFTKHALPVIRDNMWIGHRV